MKTLLGLFFNIFAVLVNEDHTSKTGVGSLSSFASCVGNEVLYVAL